METNEEIKYLKGLILQFYIILKMAASKERQAIFDKLMDDSFKDLLILGESEIQVPKELFEDTEIIKMYKDHFGITEQRVGSI